jgi:hypothetical protein
MFEDVEDVETLQLCVHTWPHTRTKEVSTRQYSSKAKGFVVHFFLSVNDTIYVLGLLRSIEMLRSEPSRWHEGDA